MWLLQSSEIQRYLFPGKYVLGRAVKNSEKTIRFTSKSVSKKHANIYIFPPVLQDKKSYSCQVVVEDLETKFGTTVNETFLINKKHKFDTHQLELKLGKSPETIVLKWEALVLGVSNLSLIQDFAPSLEHMGIPVQDTNPVETITHYITAGDINASALPELVLAFIYGKFIVTSAFVSTLCSIETDYVKQAGSIPPASEYLPHISIGSEQTFRSPKAIVGSCSGIRCFVFDGVLQLKPILDALGIQSAASSGEDIQQLSSLLFSGDAAIDFVVGTSEEPTEEFTRLLSTKGLTYYNIKQFFSLILGKDELSTVLKGKPKRTRTPKTLSRTNSSARQTPKKRDVMQELFGFEASLPAKPSPEKQVFDSAATSPQLPKKIATSKKESRSIEVIVPSSRSIQPPKHVLPPDSTQQAALSQKHPIHEPATPSRTEAVQPLNQTGLNTQAEPCNPGIVEFVRVQLPVKQVSSASSPASRYRKRKNFKAFTRIHTKNKVAPVAYVSVSEFKKTNEFGDDFSEPVPKLMRKLSRDNAHVSSLSSTSSSNRTSEVAATSSHSVPEQNNDDDLKFRF
ncbi:Mre11 complex subunit Nbs1 [Schizosaccharomyces japonicus yFS275]|uniref:Mre11 complex subunit Nbs1 n=1 Tax=Schizosaccharomyces japonicus (strain yFS275 / FY16936) TaxID=402676 RepID=B6JW70_SCHJY|nr:Mre11 complex subunit Nbs1 [Schizosaccharomyces japonicus yFS275]EEB05621.1 Mre11 complex subunit Nbs1 [Schizosaccharomyces japonicus yFS275]